MSEESSTSSASVELPADDIHDVSGDSPSGHAPISFVNGFLNSSLPFLEISEEPQQRGFRFRYRCEGPSHGGLQGERSQRGHKTYPTVKIHNYSGPAKVMVTLVTDESVPRTHAHELMGKHCDHGICLVDVQPNSRGNSLTVPFPNLGILHVTKKKVVNILKERILESMRTHDMLTGSIQSEMMIPAGREAEAARQAEEDSKSMQLNVVRLCFRAYLMDEKGTFSRVLEPAISNAVYDSKCPGVAGLSICRMDRHAGCCTGHEEVFLLCDKVQKDDISVRFFEKGLEGEVKWEAYGNFGPSDVHRQYAVVFKTPPYSDVCIENPVEVMVQLRRTSDGEISEPKPFTYYPNPSDKEEVEIKRKKPLPFPSSGGEGLLGNHSGTGCTSFGTHIITRSLADSSTNDMGSAGCYNNSNYHLGQDYPEFLPAGFPTLQQLRNDAGASSCHSQTPPSILPSRTPSSIALQQEQQRIPFGQKQLLNQVCSPGMLAGTTHPPVTLSQIQAMQQQKTQDIVSQNQTHQHSGHMMGRPILRPHMRGAVSQNQIQPHNIMQSQVQQGTVPMVGTQSQLQHCPLPPVSQNQLQQHSQSMTSQSQLQQHSPQVVQQHSPQMVQQHSPQMVQQHSPQMVQQHSPEMVQSSPQIVQQHSPPMVQQSPHMVQQMSPQMVQQQSPQMVQQMSPQMVQQHSPPLVQQMSPQMIQQQSPPMVQQMSPQMVQQMSPQLGQPQSPQMVQPQSPQMVQQIVQQIAHQADFGDQELLVLLEQEAAAHLLFQEQDGMSRQVDLWCDGGDVEVDAAVDLEEDAVPSNEGFVDFVTTGMPNKVSKKPEAVMEKGKVLKEDLIEDLANLKLTDATLDQKKEDSGFQSYASHLPSTNIEGMKEKQQAKQGQEQSPITLLIKLVERTTKALQNFASTGDIGHILLIQRHLVTMQNDKGDTPLHLAVIHHQPTVISQLLKAVSTLPSHTSIVDITNQKHHQTSLHLAVITRQSDIVSQLLKAKADPAIIDYNGNNAFHLAAISGDWQSLFWMRKLLPLDCSGTRAALESLNYEGYTPLHLAVLKQHFSCVKELMEAGADVDTPDGRSGRTALHHAVETNNHAIAGFLLLKSDAAVNAATFNGTTALHMAVGRRLVQMAVLLMTAGADPYRENNEVIEQDGESDSEDEDEVDYVRPIDMAEGNIQMLKVLEGELYLEFDTLPISGLLYTDQEEEIRTFETGNIGQLDMVTRTSLSELLDPVSENRDWQALAKGLGLHSVMDGFRRQPSPTLHVLDAYQTANGTLVELKQVLFNIHRHDAAALIEASNSEYKLRPEISKLQNYDDEHHDSAIGSLSLSTDN